MSEQLLFKGEVRHDQRLIPVICYNCGNAFLQGEITKKLLDGKTPVQVMDEMGYGPCCRVYIIYSPYINNLLVHLEKRKISVTEEEMFKTSDISPIEVKETIDLQKTEEDIKKEKVQELLKEEPLVSQTEEEKELMQFMGF